MKDPARPKKYATCLKCKAVFRVHLFNKGNHWCYLPIQEVPRHYYMYRRKRKI